MDPRDVNKTADGKTLLARWVRDRSWRGQGPKLREHQGTAEHSTARGDLGPPQTPPDAPSRPQPTTHVHSSLPPVPPKAGQPGWGGAWPPGSLKCWPPGRLLLLVCCLWSVTSATFSHNLSSQLPRALSRPQAHTLAACLPVSEGPSRPQTHHGPGRCRLRQLPHTARRTLGLQPLTLPLPLPGAPHLPDTWPPVPAAPPDASHRHSAASTFRCFPQLGARLTLNSHSGLPHATPPAFMLSPLVDATRSGGQARDSFAPRDPKAP